MAGLPPWLLATMGGPGLMIDALTGRLVPAAGASAPSAPAQWTQTDPMGFTPYDTSAQPPANDPIGNAVARGLNWSFPGIANTPPPNQATPSALQGYGAIGLEPGGFSAPPPDSPQAPPPVPSEPPPPVDIPDREKGTPAGVQQTGQAVPATAGQAPQASPQNSAQLTPEDRDYLIRTVIGESGGESPLGQLAVAHVIRNRMSATGDSGKNTVLAANQFEPWGNPQTRAKLQAIDPNSPQYKAIGDIVDSAFANPQNDPTKGSTHFFSPTVQQQLGRQMPSWSQGVDPTVTIGTHNFYSLPYGKNPPPASMSGTPESNQNNLPTPPVPSSTPPGQNPNAGVGANSFDTAKLLATLQPTQGDKMLALASGLLGGPNFGQGLSKGLSALNQLNQQGREGAVKALQLQNDMEWKKGQLGINQQKANTGDRRADVAADTNDIRRDRLDWSKASTSEKLAVQREIIGLRARGLEQQARVLEDKLAGGPQMRTDNAKTLTQFGQTAEQALRAHNSAGDLIGLIDSGNATASGPAFEDRLKHFVTSITGTSLDPETSRASGQALYDKLATQLGNQSAIRDAGGRVPRSQVEFAQFLRGAMGSGMNMQAVRALAQKLQAETGATIDAYNSLQNDPEKLAAAMSGVGGVQRYMNGELEKFYNSSPGFSTPSPGPSGGPYTYSNGKSYRAVP